MEFPQPALGERMHSFGVVLHEVLGRKLMTGARWLEFLHEVASRIGMSAVAQPAIWNYPLHGGQGGVGQTFMLPITESFLALDTWPDHRGAYLFVCSCKPFRGEAIDGVADEFGLRPSFDSDGRFRAELNLA